MSQRRRGRPSLSDKKIPILTPENKIPKLSSENTSSCPSLSFQECSGNHSDLSNSSTFQSIPPRKRGRPRKSQSSITVSSTPPTNASAINGFVSRKETSISELGNTSEQPSSILGHSEIKAEGTTNNIRNHSDRPVRERKRKVFQNFVTSYGEKPVFLTSTPLVVPPKRRKVCTDTDSFVTSTPLPQATLPSAISVFSPLDASILEVSKANTSLVRPAVELGLEHSGKNSSIPENGPKGKAKRARGRPRKYSNISEIKDLGAGDDDTIAGNKNSEDSLTKGCENKKDEMSITRETVIPSKSVRKSGRKIIHKNYDESLDDESMNNTDKAVERSKEDCESQRPDKEVVKRKRGRKPKAALMCTPAGKGKSSGAPLENEAGSSEETTATGVNSKKNKRNVRKSPQKARKDPFICSHCATQFATKPNIEYHMMTVHSLVWLQENPEGVDRPSLVIKRLGSIVCQQCGKKFRFPHYYKHHMIWCGREEETSICDICDKKMRSMWLQAHVQSHKTQEKRSQREQEVQIERQRKAEEMKKEEDAEVPADVNGKVLRKAARSAMKFMSSCQGGLQEDVVSSGDEFKEDAAESDESESEDNEEGEEEGEEEDEEGNVDEDEEDLRGDGALKSKTKTIQFPDSGKKWYFIYKCCPPKERLACLEQLHRALYSEVLFPALRPERRWWQPLPSGQRETYLLPGEMSCDFASSSHNSVGVNNGEAMSLHWGEGVSLNDKTYCFAGGPVWSVEWCPLPSEAICGQVVAVATDNSVMSESLKPHVATKGCGLIQLWSFGPLKNNGIHQPKPLLLYTLAHDSGQVRSMSWCPGGCYEQEAVDSNHFQRLGLLAVAASDGTVRVYSIPLIETPSQDSPPSSSSRCADKAETNSTTERTAEAMEVDDAHERNICVYKPPASLTLTPNSIAGVGACVCVQWQQRGDLKYILAGYGKGTVLLWDITATTPSLKVDSSTLRPQRCFINPSMAVSACAWSPQVASTFISSSLDENLSMWDINQPDFPLSTQSVSKNFEHVIARCLCWAGPVIPGFFIGMDKVIRVDTNTVNFHLLGPNYTKSSLQRMPVLLHAACVWDVSFCPYFEVLLSCDASGSVRIGLPPMQKLMSVARSRMSAKFYQNVSSAVLYKIRRREKLPDTNKPKEKEKSRSHDVGGNRCSNSNFGVALGKEKNGVQLTGAGQNDPERSRSDISINKEVNDTIPTGQSPMSGVRSRQVLEYENCEMNSSALKCSKDLQESEKPNSESFCDNSTAIHRVRINPNPSSCLWAISGGQSGLLRLDYLYELVVPNKSMTVNNMTNNNHYCMS